MRRVKFVKMVGSGNDFMIIDLRLSSIAHRPSLSRLSVSLCQRKIGIGADGLLILEKSRNADFRMRIFNADGSEAETCGNGLRCAVLYVYKHRQMRRKNLKVETKAGMYEAEVKGKDTVKIRMVEPKDLCLDFPITVNGCSLKVNYIDTGVPHTVVFVHGLDEIDVDGIGRNIRYHERFKPRGTNVDFVEFIDDKNIRIRTYERGVEGETLACGTGAVASVIVSRYSVPGTRHSLNVHTRGGVLKVYFSKAGNKIKDVYLEGEAREVYNGEVSYV